MRQLYKTICILLLVPLTLLGCATEAPSVSEPSPTPQLEPVSAIESKPISKDWSIIYQQSYKLSKYEPEVGCYLGAYVLSNKAIDFSMDRFEQAVDKKHCIYLYNMELTDEFPSNWILSCVSKNRIPLLAVRPASKGEPLAYDKYLMEQFAKRSAEYSFPLMINFYADPKSLNVNPTEYIEFYRKVRQVFRSLAPNVAFVFSVSGQNVYDSQKYYPGDDYVDWVGLSLLDKITPDSGYSPSTLKQLEFFYNLFQRQKPIMLTRLGVSHYSTSDHVYHTQEAAERIDEVMSTIIAMPRIKAFVYMDVNEIKLSDNNKGDDYTITGETSLLEAYSTMAGRQWFISEYTKGGNNFVYENFSSPFKAIKLNGEVMIPENFLTLDLDIKSLTVPKIFSDGEYFVKVADFERLSKTIVTENEEKKTIVVRLNVSGK